MKSNFEVIPAIDLLDGQIVRLKQGNYNKVTTYNKSPVEQAFEFEKAGANRLHIVDLNGAKSGLTPNKSVIKKIKDCTSLSLQVGGGIRSEHTIESYFDIGISQVILGSLLVKDFTQSLHLVNLFPNKIIAGLDIKGDYLAIEGWMETSDVRIDHILKQLNDHPLHSIIFTNIEKDGMMLGPDFEKLQNYSKISHIPFIASGGIRHKDDINTLKTYQNITGCVIGKSLLSQSLSLDNLFD